MDNNEYEEEYQISYKDKTEDFIEAQLDYESEEYWMFIQGRY